MHKLTIIFLTLTFFTSLNAATVIVNQVAKSFVGAAPDAKLQSYLTDQDALKANRFETVKIKVGDSVTFTNVDNVTHNVYAVDGEFDLKTQTIGKSDTVKFDKPGKVQVRCGIHPKMKLTIDVE